ncbi:hypothetical protein WD019_15390 [Fictibacillus sp. Mic-4]|uniref:DUF6906 family protein n=1 Tax=Fictibacillus sp. Mic-4 TaxID=3132826 RepID=UPI003CFAF07D
MKNGKRPTKRQKEHIKAMGLNPENWLIIKNLHNEMHLVHRETGSKRIVPA